MTINEIIKTLNCTTIYESKEIENKNFSHFIASDLMSDVLVIENDIDLLITSLASSQAIRTADIVCAKAVLIVNDKPISEDMQSMAKDLNIFLLKTKLPTFEVCKKLKA